jgi:hypothetical protein
MRKLKMAGRVGEQQLQQQGQLLLLLQMLGVLLLRAG